MRTLVVYSSRTGNTKMIAEAVAETLNPCDLHPVEEAPAADAYDFVALGFWVDKGMPDPACQTYMRSVNGKKVGLFGTLGVDPEHEHAKDCAAKAEAIMTESNNTVFGTFLSQGKIDPKIVEVMRKTAQDVHPMTPERIARIEAAKSHPNEKDCRKAREAFAGFRQAALG